jgi:hypothetical protein
MSIFVLELFIQNAGIWLSFCLPSYLHPFVREPGSLFFIWITLKKILK